MMHSEYKKRALIIWWILGFLAIFLLIKLFYIQVLKNKYYKAKSKEIHQKKGDYILPRGTIFDKEGNILAISAESISVGVHPGSISTKNYLRVCKLLNIKPLHLNKNRDFVWLKRRLPINEGDIIKAKIKTKDKKIPSGIDFIVEHKRHYPHETIGGNLLGFVQLEDDAKKISGLSGIEASFNKYLLSSSRNLKIIKDGRGRILYTQERFPDASKGGDVWTAIELKVQYIAEEELKKTCEEYDAQGGVAIIGNPKTGEILALATYPGFDPNIYSTWNPEIWRKTSREKLKNKAVSWVFEPGSLLKPIIAGILLQEGLVKPEDRFFCAGEYKIGNRTIHCHIKHGDQSFKDVLKNSCNVGMSQAIEKLNSEKLLFYLSQFGFGTKTNTGLIEEESGIFPKSIPFLRKANISFGYGVSVTPIQIYMAMSAICNKGLLLSPIIIRSILLNNRVIKEYQPTPISEVLSVDTTNKIKNMMVDIVTSGTGVNAKIEGYTIAGKTGTAEKAAGGRYNPNRVIASFIGFFPANNPELLILVILDEPKKAYFASIVAAPCFKRIAERMIFLKKIRQ